MLQKYDRDGNRIYLNDYDGDRAIYLKLVSMERPLTLGVLTRGVLEIEKKGIEQYYRIGHGWCFNAALMENAEFFGFDRVRFSSKYKNVKKKTYGIEDMRANFIPGIKYKSEGYEKQVCLNERFFGVVPAPDVVREPPIKTKTQKRLDARAKGPQMSLGF